ncbi:hypothetical protein B296_00046630, partial [Ensete ventricosum]
LFFQIASEEKDSILGNIPIELKEKGSMLYTTLLDGKLSLGLNYINFLYAFQGGLQNLIKSIKEQDPDKVSIGLASSLDTVAELELLQVLSFTMLVFIQANAPGLSFLLPEQYMKYPRIHIKHLHAIGRLTGRGTIEFTIEKVDGTTFFPSAGGEPKTTTTIQVCFIWNNSMACSNIMLFLKIDFLVRSHHLQVVLDGYSTPLTSGNFAKLDGELPVLPLSVYGAVAMAHNIDSDEYSSPSQFFFYLYDKRNAGLGGLSFDEGQFSVFG